LGRAGKEMVWVVCPGEAIVMVTGSVVAYPATRTRMLVEYTPAASPYGLARTVKEMFPPALTEVSVGNWAVRPPTALDQNMERVPAYELCTLTVRICCGPFNSALIKRGLGVTLNEDVVWAEHRSGNRPTMLK